MGESDNKTDVETTPAAPLSPEFLGGGTAAGLEKLRARLLDLTNRNRLLNFRHSNASSLRIVDADLNAIFSRLIDGEEIPFRHVPEPDTSPESETDGVDETAPISKPLAADYAESLGWNTSYDLNSPSPRNAASQFLPVLLYVDDLETKTRKIASAANTAIEESGTLGGHPKPAINRHLKTGHLSAVDRDVDRDEGRVLLRRYGKRLGHQHTATSHRLGSARVDASPH